MEDCPIKYGRLPYVICRRNRFFFRFAPLLAGAQDRAPGLPGVTTRNEQVGAKCWVVGTMGAALALCRVAGTCKILGGWHVGRGWGGGPCSVHAVKTNR